jgi:single-strand DNA-binding protein
MSNYNKVILMGNLTRDPDIRTLMGGGKVAKLGLAINRRYKDREGQLREETTFVDIDFFGPMADTLQQYARKGGGLHIEGRLSLDTWQDKATGQNRYRLKVLGERFQFVGGRPQEREESPPDSRADPPPTSPGSDEDIPF